MAFSVKVSGESGGNGHGDLVIDEGTYDARLTRIEEKSNDSGSYWMWTFELRVAGRPRTTSGVTNPNLDEGSKGRIWSQELLGRQLHDGEDLDLESLYGKPCSIELTTKELTNGKVVNRIARVTRRSVPAPKATAKPQYAAPADEEAVDHPF